MKFCIFPIENAIFWNHYKKQMSAIWTMEEIDFSGDKKDFEALSAERQHIVKMILAFFANSDGLVNFNIQNNLLGFEENEITYTYVFQMFMEQIHNECYSMLIETLITDDKEKELLFKSITTIPIIKIISDWGINNSNDNVPVEWKVLVFICFEGIMFSGSFAIIYWLKSICGNGKLFMSGLIKSNELISRDEGMHVDFGIDLFKHITKDKQIYSTDVNKIIIEAVNLTFKFNEEVLQIRDEGINVELMNEYTKYVADRILVQLGYSKIYKSSNPFSFMNTIGMVQKTNFHESRPTEYMKAPPSNEELEVSDDF